MILVSAPARDAVSPLEYQADVTIELFRGASHGLTVGKDETLDERYLRTLKVWLRKRVAS